MNRLRFLALAVFSLASFSSDASIAVDFYAGISNLPQTVAGDILTYATGLSPGYARINNSSHVNFSGSSTQTFGRYQDGGGVCYYWHRSTETFSGLNFFDSWEYVYWEGFGDGTLVDGAEPGSDNFILYHDGTQAVAVLQFDFDNTNNVATLIASAYDPSGITFADGVSAIQAIPEPATALFAFAGIVTLAITRRRK